MADILFLTPQLPYPPQQGTTLRNFNLIAGLARRGHVIDLVSFSSDDGSTGPGEQESRGDSAPLLPCSPGPLRAFCRRIITVPAPVRRTAQRARDTLLHPLPDMALRLESPAMRAAVTGALAGQRYDVVEVEGIEMAPYALNEKKRGGPYAHHAPPVVFDDHNAEYVLQQRAFLTDVRRPARWPGALYSLIQWRKLAGYERGICRAAAAVVAVSEADRSALQRLLPGLAVTVVPNGVDLDFYRPGCVEPLPSLARPSLVFTGKMDYRPNVDAVLWFADEVLPLIRRQFPAAHFYVVGQQPHPRLGVLRDRPGITVTGRVDDVRPYMAAADVYVAPLRIGGGTRLKILEAMAAGLPVVSTRLGCDGFPFEDGRELRFADAPAAFASAVAGLLADRRQAERLGRSAREFVAAHYGWENIVPKLEGVYERAGL